MLFWENKFTFRNRQKSIHSVTGLPRFLAIWFNQSLAIIIIDGPENRTYFCWVLTLKDKIMGSKLCKNFKIIWIISVGCSWEWQRFACFMEGWNLQKSLNSAEFLWRHFSDKLTINMNIIIFFLRQPVTVWHSCKDDKTELRTKKIIPPPVTLKKF